MSPTPHLEQNVIAEFWKWNESQYVGAAFFTNAGEISDAIKSIDVEKYPSPVLHEVVAQLSTMSEIDTVIQRMSEFVAAYKHAQIVAMEGKDPMETGNGYSFEEFCANPYTFLDRDEYQHLTMLPQEAWAVAKLLKTAMYVLRFEKELYSVRATAEEVLEHYGQPIDDQQKKDILKLIEKDVLQKSQDIEQELKLACGQYSDEIADKISRFWAETPLTLDLDYAYSLDIGDIENQIAQAMIPHGYHTAVDQNLKSLKTDESQQN